jgi:hypothetical protein
MLETGFGFGLNFLVTWAAWRADPQRPRLLHFISTEAWPVSAADLLRAASAHPELAPLAEELHAQWWGLLPGVHRLAFDGRARAADPVLATRKTVLRQQAGPPIRSTWTDSAPQSTLTSGACTPSRPWRAAAAGARAWPPGPLPAPCAMRWRSAASK